MNYEPPKTDLPTIDVLLNATSLTYSHCEQAYYMTVVRGLRTLEQIEAINMGNALHKYAELRALGSDNSGALVRALDVYNGDHKQLLVQACAQMPTDIPCAYVDANGQAYVEHKFKIYWQTIVFEGTAFNIWVCGTYDIVTLTGEGIVRIRDYKSTRRWKAAEVFELYRTSVQCRFYLWAAQKFGHYMFDLPVANATDRNFLYLQHTGIFLSGTHPRWVHGSIIQLTMAELVEFEQLLMNQLMSVILPAWLRPVTRGMVNGTCDGCNFTRYCFESTQNGKDIALHGYQQIPYDPMTFRT